MTKHGDFQELLGAYALDAVDVEERDELERHLATCPRCRAEVAEHREVAGLLGYAGSDAPPGLWDRIAVGLEEPPPALQLTRMPSGQPVTEGSRAAATAGATVVPIGRSRRTIGVRAFAALAAVAALAAAILGVEVVRLNDKTNDLVASIGTQAIQTAYNAARSNPGARQVVLKSSTGSQSTAAVILPDGTAYLDPRNLPALPANETYQLWGVIGSDKISLAVIGSEPRLVEFGAPTNVAALAVTAERAGGVVVAQHQPIVVGAVPATSPTPTTIRNA